VKAFQRLLVAAPAAVLLPVALAPVGALANDLNLDAVQEYSVAQGASIRDFSDVYPTDWAYQALAELVETYGCVAGYPDGTFRGEQTVTRYEMAAVLSDCLSSMSATMDMKAEEMESMEMLKAEFSEELITLKAEVDALDLKVAALEEKPQFSTTTTAEFSISTDFAYFASDDVAARNDAARTEDNSGLALSSEVTVNFETSFTGSDKLTFSLSGDLLTRGEEDANNYLKYGDFYDVAGNEGAADFSGFIYESNFDLGVPLTLTLGTDVDEMEPIVGVDTYYGGSGYDDYGVGNFMGGGAAGLGFNAALLDSDAGTVNFSAAYSVAGAHASNQTGDGGLFGEDSDKAFAVALNWDGALFGGNDAKFTVAYQNATIQPGSSRSRPYPVSAGEVTTSLLSLVAGTYFTDTISLSGHYSFGQDDLQRGPVDPDLAQWMIAVNMDDAFFPGNSAGIAYGTPLYGTTLYGTTLHVTNRNNNVMRVLELYYDFQVNDNFTVPVYLDFITNSGHSANADAFGLAVRPTLTF